MKLPLPINTLENTLLGVTNTLRLLKKQQVEQCVPEEHITTCKQHIAQYEQAIKILKEIK
jgi:hypothetical protein